MITKILIAFFFTLYSLFSSTSVFAQATSSASLTPIPSYIPPTSPIYTDLLVNNLFHSFSCLAIGQSMLGQPCLTYQVTKNTEGAIQSVPMLSQVNLSGGTLGAVTGIIAGLYQNPPVRTADYLASVGQGLGVKEAHAQVVGSGANVLNPIFSLWKVSRNISYVIMIIIFVVIGLMVMFRNKINPQTVITAQTALPGLVIGLILITFSYFLAGLISDTAFIGTNVVGYYFSTAQSGSTPKLVSDIATENAASIFSRFVGAIYQRDIAGLMSSIMNTLNDTVNFYIKLFAGIIGFQTGNSIGGPIGVIGGTTICGVAPTVVIPIAGVALGAIGAPLCALLGGTVGGVITGALLAGIAYADPVNAFAWVAYFIAIAILIYTMFKLLLRLINSYLTIIFLTISAPFQFLAAALPGRQGIATGWIITMLGNVLAFPAVFAVFYFVGYLLGPASDGGKFFGITNQFNPTGNQTFPLFGGVNLSFIKILLAFGALLATPAIPDMILKAIGKVSQAGQLIGQEISGSARSGQGYFGQTTGGIGRAAGSINQIGDTWYGKPPGLSVAEQLAKTPGVNLPPWLKKHW